jgi:hypothetical protein
MNIHEVECFVFHGMPINTVIMKAINYMCEKCVYGFMLSVP